MKQRKIYSYLESPRRAHGAQSNINNQLCEIQVQKNAFEPAQFYNVLLNRAKQQAHIWPTKTNKFHVFNMKTQMRLELHPQRVLALRNTAA